MKKSKGFGLLAVIIIIIVTALVSGLATGVIMLNSRSKSYSNLTNDKQLKEFIDVYETILSKYYDEVDKEGMLNAAEEAMLNFLGDKYTTYLNDSEYNKIVSELAGTYDGIGITINNNVIMSVIKDSPAMNAGLLENDVISKVNGEDVLEKSGIEISELIKKSDNKEVILVIIREGEELEYKIEKQNLVNPVVTYKKIENTNIGYIHIKIFSDNLSLQLSNAISELEKDNVDSLIIDVRDNVGGYLKSAEETTSIFLEKGKVIYSLESNNKKYSYYDETKEKKEYPIIVLINENSASSAEIFAAALKESYGATLVGTKSYGKGKVQQVISLKNGNSVKYTSAKWLTPNGICVEGAGLEPDYVVEYELSNLYDTQIDKAIELLG